MPEWLYEAGIGEARAALVEDGAIVELCIEPDDRQPRAGAVLSVRLIAREGRRAIVRDLEEGREGMIDGLDPAIPLGAAFAATVVRAAIPEPGALKRMKLRATPDAAPAPGPDLHARIAATGHPVRTLTRHQPDALEAAGWSEQIDEALAQGCAFEGGRLRISLTPAMTLIDVDGSLAPLPLAMAGAKAAAAAIRRFGLAGSIGIDLPTVAGKAERQAIAGAFDAILPQPYERTAINGFGFLQIVRPRLRASLVEQLAHDRAGHFARALLRTAERSGIAGAATLVAPEPVAAVIAAHRAWTDALGTALGGTVTLQPDPALAISGGHVFRSH